MTFTCQNRLPMLDRDRTREWLRDAIIRARDLHHLELWAYVFMPEHAHLFFLPLQRVYDMSLIGKSIKQPVARRATNWLRKNAPAFLEQLKIVRPGERIEYRFWLQGPGYDRNATEPKTAWEMVNYFHENPVRRGLVKRAIDWTWSSARQYAGLDGVFLEMNGRPPDPPL
ncbi:MAG: hypothetical protein WD768_08085 [Phycisphaeraceae bacterium]